MATPPLRPCNRAGCRNLTRERYCERCAAKRHVEDRERRGSARQRGYTTGWEKARAAHLAEHPLCVRCQSEGRVVPATVVDHVIPHRGDPGKFWDRGNWQSLCASHHNYKTFHEEGPRDPASYAARPGGPTPESFSHERRHTPFDPEAL